MPRLWVLLLLTLGLVALRQYYFGRQPAAQAPMPEAASVQVPPAVTAPVAAPALPAPPAQGRATARFIPPVPKRTSRPQSEPEPEPLNDVAVDLSGLDEEPAAPSVVDTSKVYTYVEQMPEPPGGHEGLMRYLAKSLKYPPKARPDQVAGNVFVRFVIRRDGKITNVAVLKGLGPGYDAEAVRAIRRMPAWTPGRQNGQLVNVSYTLPVTVLIR
jgi:protein TonB